MAGGDYKPLFVGLSTADAQSLGQKLATQNIPYELSSDGTSVLVPVDQLDKARVGVASQGPLSSGRMGFELFDKPNWSGSDFSERVNYQRALEAELERTIQTMTGVEAVRVHLVLPHESLFTDRERPAKAAVVLKLRGQRMSEQIGGSIANLVSSAWDDLSPQNVTVVTTDGQTMPGPSHGSSYGNVEMSGASGDLETVMAEKVVQVLAPIVGPDHVRSSVSIEYDPTSGESTQDSYDPNSTVVLTSQTSQENSNDIAPAGIPGTPSNAPNTPPSKALPRIKPAPTARRMGIRSENKTFAVSHTTHHLIEPPGRIKRVAAAILVDDAVETKMTDGKPAETRRKRTPEELKQIEELSKSGARLGFHPRRSDFRSRGHIQGAGSGDPRPRELAGKNPRRGDEMDRPHPLRGNPGPVYFCLSPAAEACGEVGHRRAASCRTPNLANGLSRLCKSSARARGRRRSSPAQLRPRACPPPVRRSRRKWNTPWL